MMQWSEVTELLERMKAMIATGETICAVVPRRGEPSFYREMDFKNEMPEGEGFWIASVYRPDREGGQGGLNSLSIAAAMKAWVNGAEGFVTHKAGSDLAQRVIFPGEYSPTKLTNALGCFMVATMNDSPASYRASEYIGWHHEILDFETGGPSHPRTKVEGDYRVESVSGEARLLGEGELDTVVHATLSGIDVEFVASSLDRWNLVLLFAKIMEDMEITDVLVDALILSGFLGSKRGVAGMAQFIQTLKLGKWWNNPASLEEMMGEEGAARFSEEMRSRALSPFAPVFTGGPDEIH